MYSIKFAFEEIVCTIQNARHSFISKLMLCATEPCLSINNFEYKNNHMEVGIHGLLTGNMAIEFFKLNQVYSKLKHCFVSRVWPPRLSVWTMIAKQNPKPLFYP